MNPRPSCVCGSCRVCRHRATNARSRARLRPLRPVVGRLPVSPLMEHVTAGELRQMGYTHVYVWLNRGWLNEYVADSVAVSIGMHPGIIWDEWWEVA